eukprot:Skav220533  [mRNA]  locus=scaffold5103:8701:10326:+ [translate_table: standard]
MEADSEVGYPSWDSADDVARQRWLENARILADFIRVPIEEGAYTERAASAIPPPEALSSLPPEWPMARFVLRLASASSMYKQTMVRSTLEKRLCNPEAALRKSDVIMGISDSLILVAELIASLFSGVGNVDFVQRFKEWALFEDHMFWYKSLITELAGAVQAFKTTREGTTLDPRGRNASTMQSFVMIHDVESIISKGNLPLRNTKVYFPVAFLSLVISNAKRLGFLGSWQDETFGSDDVVVRQKKYEVDPCRLLLVEEGNADVPELKPQVIGATRFPLTRQLVGAGLLASKVIELLAGRLNPTRLHVEIRAPTLDCCPVEGTAPNFEEDRIEDYIPSNWDLMTVTPGKLMSFGANLGEDTPFTQIMARYGDYLFEGLNCEDAIKSNLERLFFRDGAHANPRQVEAAFDTPGWAPPGQANHTYQKGWWKSIVRRSYYPIDDAWTRIGPLRNNGYFDKQEFLPWTYRSYRSQTSGRSTAASAVLGRVDIDLLVGRSPQPFSLSLNGYPGAGWGRFALRSVSARVRRHGTDASCLEESEHLEG